MTVRAPNDTLCDLQLQYGQPSALSDKYRDIAQLPTYDMVELEHDGIDFTAIDTGMRSQEVGNKFLISPAISCRVDSLGGVVGATVSLTICSKIARHAFRANRASFPTAFTSEPKLGLRLGQAAAPAGYHYLRHDAPPRSAAPLKWPTFQ